MSGERLLSVFEAEDLTGRKASTWRRDILERRVGRVKIGRLVRIPLSEVQRLIDHGYQPPLLRGDLGARCNKDNQAISKDLRR